MNSTEVQQELAFGLENLERVYQNIIRFTALVVEPDLKTSALTYECLGYYNALEHLMVRVLKALAYDIPSGAFSHRETLKLFCSLERTQFNNPKMLVALQTLMAFRHVATKIYGFLIEWEKLNVVVTDIQRFHPEFVRWFETIRASFSEPLK